MGEEPLWRRYLRFRGPDVEADIDDELAFHLEMRERDFLAAGLGPREAREAAHARFGDMAGVREWLRDHDRARQRRRERVEVMDQLLQDVRYGWRKLRQQPGFTAAAVAVLALGIGATTAIFSAVDAALLRPLPFASDDRLVGIDMVHIPLRITGESFPKSSPDITDLATLPEAFTSYGAYATGGLNLTGAGEPRRVRIAMVTPSFFSTLGVRPASGRPFLSEEGTPEGGQAVILSHALWRGQFGGARDVLGRGVTLNGKRYRVMGVMPRGFAFPSATEVWMPMPVPMTMAHWEPFRQYMPSRVVARLAPGVTVEQAGARVRSLFHAYGRKREPPRPEELVVPLRQVLVGDRGKPLLVLLGATALVLLVACANVANLLLSRAAARRQEMAMRVVLGASPWRVLRQLLVESLILAGMGGVAGVLLAFAGLGALESLVPERLVGAAPLRIDARVLLFTAAVALLMGFAFGLWPALSARRASPGEAIRGGQRGSGGEQSRLRRLFVVGEIALALMLSIGAGVMLRSFQALLATDAGLQAERAATLELTLDRASYLSPASRREFLRRVLERLEAIPQVEAAGFVNELPLRGEGGVRITVEGEGAPEREERIFAQDLRVTPDYFRALGIPIARGRSLSATVDSAAPKEMVINEELARLLWPGENPVGRRVLFGFNERFEVVGVAGNVRPKALDQDEVIPQMYGSLFATPYSDLALVARGRAREGVLAGWMQQAIRDVAPHQAVYNVRSMEEVISETIAPRRTNTALITGFGLLAVVLAAVGVYGVIAYGVARRTREIGIRIALGARSGDVVAQVMREGIALAVAGVALGLLGAWVLTRVLSSLVYGVSPRDPLVFAVSGLVLLAVAALATLLPARRATRVDPAVALRAE